MKLRHTSLYSALAVAVLTGLPLGTTKAGIVRLVFNNSSELIGLSQLGGTLISYFNHSNDRFMQLRLSEPLLCAEFPGASNNHVRIRFIDANGDVIPNSNSFGAANTFGGLTEGTSASGGIRYVPVAGGEQRLQLNTSSELVCVKPGTFLPSSAAGVVDAKAGYQMRAGGDVMKAERGSDIIFDDSFEDQGSGIPIEVVTSMSAPTTVRAGQNFVYSFTVRNNGTSALSNVQVRDFFYKRSSQNPGAQGTPLPTLADGTWSCSPSNGATCGSFSSGVGIVYTSGLSLQPGAQATFTATRRVNDSPAPAAGMNFSVAAAAFIAPALGEPVSSNNLAIANAQVVETQPPVISSLPVNPSILEDSGVNSFNFTISDPDTNPSAVSVTGSSNNAGVISNSGGVTIGGAGASRILNLTPVANVSGNATITVSANDGGNSDQETVNVTVVPVNDAPSFTWRNDCPLTSNPGASWTPENGSNPGQFTYPAGAQNSQNCANFLTVSMGAPDEAGQSLTDVALLSNSNPNLFAEQPSLKQNGNTAQLFFRPNGSSGTANISVQITDSGGTDNGGQNTSAVKTFRVRVEGAIPTITAVGNQTINEDGATGAIAFTINDTDTPIGNLVVSTSNNNATLLPPGSVVLGGSGNNRTVSITPAANAFGSANVTLTVSDGDQTAQRVFALTVNPVNDAPSFSNLGNQSFASGVTSGTKQVTGWASNLVMGPPNESDQQPDLFVVERLDSNVPNIMGTTPPSVSLVSNPIGRLSFPLANNGSGIAIDGYACYQVSLFDSGESDPPNQNQSVPVVLKIQVGPGDFTCPAARTTSKRK